MKNTFSNDYTADWQEVARATKDEAGWKCIRCGHIHEQGWILTVHHLDGDKANNAWWNVLALCQRCHLRIQGKVILSRPWMLEHSDWFKPYVAGYYARQAGLPDDKEFVTAHMVELLAVGQGVTP